MKSFLVTRSRVEVGKERWSKAGVRQEFGAALMWSGRPRREQPPVRRFRVPCQGVASLAAEPIRDCSAVEILVRKCTTTRAPWLR